jgi:hypothetical protein
MSQHDSSHVRMVVNLYVENVLEERIVDILKQQKHTDYQSINMQIIT